MFKLPNEDKVSTLKSVCRHKMQFEVSILEHYAKQAEEVVFKLFYSISEFLERLISIFKKINQCYKDNHKQEKVVDYEDVLPTFLSDQLAEIEKMMIASQRIIIAEQLKNTLRKSCSKQKKEQKPHKKKTQETQRSSLIKTRESRTFKIIKDRVLKTLDITKYRTLFLDAFPDQVKEAR